MVTAIYLLGLSLIAKLSGIPAPIPKVISGLALVCYAANIIPKMLAG